MSSPIRVHAWLAEAALGVGAVVGVGFGAMDTALGRVAVVVLALLMVWVAPLALTRPRRDLAPEPPGQRARDEAALREVRAALRSEVRSPESAAAASGG